MGKMKRRLVKVGMWAIVISAALVFIGCGGERQRTLFVCNWSDYVDPEVVQGFEREYGCRVVIDAMDDNETMLAKMLAGATGYDVVFPSSYIVPVMVGHGLLGELDTNLLPNVTANLDYGRYGKVFSGGVLKWSVPYSLSATGIAYRRDVYEVKGDGDRRWNLLTYPVFRGRVCILNDMREVLGVGLIKRGYSPNTKSAKGLGRALEYAKDLKRHASKMDSVQYRVGLVSGETLAAMAYSCDVLQVLSENPESPISFFIPEEGSTCCWDEMVVTRNADRELAHAFIDYLYRPEVAARNLGYVNGTVPNVGMWEYAEESMRTNEWYRLSEDNLRRLHLIEDVGDAMGEYVKAWDAFMAE